MADFLDEKRKEIEARLRELRPLVDEYNRLEKAASALSGVGGNRRTAAAPRLGSKPSPVNASRAPCNRRTDVPPPQRAPPPRSSASGPGMQLGDPIVPEFTEPLPSSDRGHPRTSSSGRGLGFKAINDGPHLVGHRRTATTAVAASDGSRTTTASPICHWLPQLAQRDTRRPARLAGGGPRREPFAPSGDHGRVCTAPVDLHEEW